MADKSTKKKTFDQIGREGTPEEIAATMPPAGKYIPAAMRRAVYQRDNYTCFFCGKHVEQMDKGELTLDHFIPRVLGGPNTYDNLFTACKSCNCRKGKIGPAFITERMVRGIRKFGR